MINVAASPPTWNCAAKSMAFQLALTKRVVWIAPEPLPVNGLIDVLGWAGEIGVAGLTDDNRDPETNEPSAYEWECPRQCFQGCGVDVRAGGLPDSPGSCAGEKQKPGDDYPNSPRRSDG